MRSTETAVTERAGVPVYRRTTTEVLHRTDTTDTLHPGVEIHTEGALAMR